MNLRDLEYLIAVAEHRNFHKAADACFVSQPTLSAQLKKLEQYLDVVLIERNPGNIMLTEIGDLVHARAQKIIQLSKEIKQVAKDSGDIYAGSLEMGLIPTIAPYLLPRVSKPLKDTFPKLDIKLHELQTHQLLSALRKGRIDVAIMALPVQQGLEGLKTLDLYHEPFYLAVNASHPLAERKEVTLDDIKELELVLLERGHCLRDHANDLCKLVDANIDHVYTATSLETLRHMITVNEVITLMPGLAVDLHRDADQSVVYIPFSNKKLSRRVVLVYRNKSHKKSIFESLVDVLKTIQHK